MQNRETNMKYASEDLRNEHEGVLYGLGILEQMVRTVRLSGAADTSDIEDMINFLRLFADKCHHGKEEGFLFPAMEKAGIPNVSGPIAQMLAEHNQGRQYIAEMGASVADGNLQPDRFTKAAAAYIDLMRAHVEKENTVLFRVGDKMLPVQEQEHLLNQFEEFEEEVMGKGTHEKLHETLHSLENKYLKTK